MATWLDVLVGEGDDGQGFGYEPAAALAIGAVFIIGADGDLDPGRVLRDIEIRNTDSADDLWVAATLTAAVTAQAERWKVPAGEKRFIPGAFATLVIHNPATSGDKVAWDMVALKTGRRNQGVQGGHPGHGEHIARITAVQDDDVTVDVLVTRDLTLTGVKPFSASKNTSAGGGVTMTVHRQRGDVNLLSSSTYDLEGLTNGTPGTATLTATTANLALNAGDVVEITVSSDNADMAEGDLAVALLSEPR